MTSIELNGRKVILTNVDEITRGNILNVLSKAFTTHLKNVKEIRYLSDYYKGKQPILNRIKVNRPEICNKIVVNRAFEIVEFKKGYTFGEPIQYVQRGDCQFDEKALNTGVSALNEYMMSENKPTIDAQIAEHMHICGTAYKFLFPKKSEVDVDEAPFRLSALNPENTFVIYKNDSYKTPILGVKYVIKTDTNRKSNLELVAYTDTRCYRVESPFNFCLFDEKSTIKESVNGIGAIPIIEYPLNESRLGCFEIVIGLLDAINSTESNRMDGIEQFIQSFVKFTNCDIDSDSFRQLRSDGAIVIKGSPGLPADAQIMESSLDQQQAQTSANNLYQSVLTITGVPDREASAGGNTGQALIIGQGWASAEARAKATEAIFKKSERESLKVLLKIIKLTHKMPKELADLHLSDIDIKFTRNKTDNLLTKTQGLQNLVEVGVHPRIALSTVGLFSDPEQVYDDSKEYLSKWLTTQSSEAPNNQVTPSNNKPVPEDTE